MHLAELKSDYAGSPILVIGGGPSAMHDLPRLSASHFSPSLVLSANEHGCYQSLFRVDMFVSVAPNHAAKKQPMKMVLRNLAPLMPIVSPHDWGDILMDNLGIHDSGLTAIAVAAFLGGSPIVPVGIDGFNTGRRYFHSAEQYTRPCESLDEIPIRLLRERWRPFLDACVGASVKPMHGPLTRIFPAYAPES